MNGLFTDTAKSPLAERLRPQDISEVIGQDHLLQPGGGVYHALHAPVLPSMILWGGTGCGKTTLARLIVKNTQYNFKTISAVFSGVADLRKVFEQATKSYELGEKTVLFVDEIHRFNKSQQDSFLPYVENGTVVLIGATTENPSFECNPALLSRCQVFCLNPLNEKHMHQLLQRAEQTLNTTIPLDLDARNALCNMADGDGRYFLNMVEMLMGISVGEPMNTEQLATVVHRRMPVYDKSGDSHYNMLSAFHKSVRGSDVHAALFYMGRMLAGGEDPLHIARRMLCIAYEDVGLADPMAAHQATMAWDTFKRLGSPEGERALVQCCIYLATAPKSNAVELAKFAMLDAGKKYAHMSPPKNILNAPTKMMQDMGYHAGYKYDHDHPDAFSGQNFFPEEMDRVNLYTPNQRGFEREIKKRVEYYEKLRNKRKDM